MVTPKLWINLSVHWRAIHLCCAQGHPVMAMQQASILYLSATQSASSLVPDLHSEHFRTTSLVPSQTVNAPAHGGHRHASKPFLQPATPRAVTAGSGVKLMCRRQGHTPLAMQSYCTLTMIGQYPICACVFSLLYKLSTCIAVLVKTTWYVVSISYQSEFGQPHV